MNHFSFSKIYFIFLYLVVIFVCSKHHISVICVLLVVFTKKEILHKNILFGIETQTHNTIMLMQWVPLSAVMRHAGVTPRGTVSVSAVRVLGI